MTVLLMFAVPPPSLSGHSHNYICICVFSGPFSPSSFLFFLVFFFFKMMCVALFRYSKRREKEKEKFPHFKLLSKSEWSQAKQKQRRQLYTSAVQSFADKVPPSATAASILIALDTRPVAEFAVSHCCCCCCWSCSTVDLAAAAFEMRTLISPDQCVPRRRRLLLSRLDASSSRPSLHAK